MHVVWFQAGIVFFFAVSKLFSYFNLSTKLGEKFYTKTVPSSVLTIKTTCRTELFLEIWDRFCRLHFFSSLNSGFECFKGKELVSRPFLFLILSSAIRTFDTESESGHLLSVGQ